MSALISDYLKTTAIADIFSSDKLLVCLFISPFTQVNVGTVAEAVVLATFLKNISERDCLLLESYSGGVTNCPKQS